MSVTQCEVRRGAYYDSVVLMQLQRALSELPGVQDAGVVMATEANLALLAESDLLAPEAKEAGPDDLLLAVKASDAQRASSALAQVDDLLKRRRSQSSHTFQPRSLSSAIKTLPAAEWVLVSVPGRYAAGVAREALEAERHVFLYSDNVSIDDEVALKRLALEKGRLVMGPDCGTAIINGTGLGFANHVRRGQIGLVAASGTGLQAISSHIQRLGGGVSQAIGTGGRDLAQEVGGVTTLQALDLLARDEETTVIVLVSKPPAAQVAARVLAKARSVAKPVVVYFMGQPMATRRTGNLHFAYNLLDAAELAMSAQNVGTGAHQASATRIAKLDNRFVRGLFSGGTLAYELLLGMQGLVAPLFSNVPLHAYQELQNPLKSEAHTVLDMGADEFTQGRLHPMMDNTLRIRRMQQEADDPMVGLIILDVVLGEGAHPDPAGTLAPVITEITDKGQADVAVLLVGTEDDPQDLAAQREKLDQAGAHLFDSTVDLVAAIAESIVPAKADETAPVPTEAFGGTLAAINVGLESFYDSLAGQGAQAVQVAWRPPAGGNEKMMALLAKLKSN